MKKSWILMGAATLLIATGCSEKTEGSPDKEVVAQDQQKEVKSALLDFQMNLVSVINQHDGVLYDLEKEKEKEEDRLSDEQLESGISEGSIAVSSLNKGLKEIEIQNKEVLSDHKEELDDIVNTFVAAFSKWDEEQNIQDDAGFKAFEEEFKKAEEKLNKIYKEVGLAEVSILKATLN
ncbi:hypothetical protein QTG56_22845 (plasmid) [Rossellomorea sp. AcN35-11]|nr:hypothetical protein [Rossellomorea aquimaris]WJV32209.1 hypothetical protein QTG56_22845 [Rossellomorea sp. AcN35-11]